jgi:hypothetical protein
MVVGQSALGQFALVGGLIEGRSHTNNKESLLCLGWNRKNKMTKTMLYMFRTVVGVAITSSITGLTLTWIYSSFWKAMFFTFVNALSIGIGIHTWRNMEKTYKDIVFHQSEIKRLRENLKTILGHNHN